MFSDHLHDIHCQTMLELACSKIFPSLKLQDKVGLKRVSFNPIYFGIAMSFDLLEHTFPVCFVHVRVV